MCVLTPSISKGFFAVSFAYTPSTSVVWLFHMHLTALFALIPGCFSNPPAAYVSVRRATHPLAHRTSDRT